MIRCLFIFALLLPLCLVAQTPPSLLSDNMPPGGGTKLYPKGTPVIHTRATYSYVTEGEFATDKETLSSSEPEGVKRLFDGGDWWKSQTFSEWSGRPWVTVIVDLRRDYVIGQIDVWALRDSQRDTEKTMVLFSSDGEAYTQHGVAENTTAEPVDEVDGKKNFIKHTLELDKPVRARYVQLRIKKRRHQQQLADIAIWGWRVEGQSSIIYLEAGEKPTVPFDVRSIQDGAAFMTWTDGARRVQDVSKWHVYASDAPFTRVDAEGVRLAHSFDKRTTQAPLYPYEPGSTVHFALAPVYGDAVDPGVASQAFRFPMPFERETLGDMLAVNHFPGGGAKVRSEAWRDFSLDLMQQTPLRGSRWWYIYPQELELFLNRGMGMITWPLRGKGAQDNVGIANRYGLHSFTKGNEPELKGTTPANYLKGLKAEHAIAKERHPANTIAAPTCNLNPAALDWLERFYQEDAKEYFDVLDLHTYCDKPEDLFEKMALVRAIMEAHGDGDKPIISTEYGYSDRPGGKNRVSPLQKAQYLSRGLVIHYVLGFKRVYIYSLADIGTDPYNNEHHFGLLDYDLQKKPAYHAVMTLGAQLGDTVLDGPLPGCEAPNLGYQFTTPEKAAYVAVVWNGEEERVGTFTTEAEELEVTDIFGSTRRIVVDETRLVSLPYGASPIYIRASAPIAMTTSTVNTVAPAATGEAAIDFQLSGESMIVAADATTATLAMNFRSTFTEDVACTVTVKDAAGTTVGSSTVTAAAQATTAATLPVTLEMPADTVLRHYAVMLSYKTAVSTYSEERSVAIRRLVPTGDGVTVVTRLFEGVAQPIYILANAAMEVSFDPQQGGRMLEMLDRASKTNQIRLDYDKAGDLTRFQHAYAMWFSFNKGLRNSPWEATPENGALALSAVDKKTGAALTMRWSLDPAAPTLRLEITIANRSDKEVAVTSFVHPEYQVSGYGESTTDQLFFPTADGEHCLPFWIDLGERTLPEVTENRWRITDTVSGLSLLQTYSPGWQPPRVWFGHGCYNIEMTQVTTLQAQETQTVWIDWTLDAPMD